MIHYCTSNHNHTDAPCLPKVQTDIATWLRWLPLLFESGRAATWVNIAGAAAPSAIVVGAAGFSAAAGRNRGGTTAGYC